MAVPPTVVVLQTTKVLGALLSVHPSGVFAARLIAASRPSGAKGYLVGLHSYLQAANMATVVHRRLAHLLCLFPAADILFSHAKIPASFDLKNQKRQVFA